MRISTSMMAHNLINRLQWASEQLYRAQEQAASGRVINRPSDNPAGSSHVSSLRSALSELQQYKENTTSAINFLSATDSALGELSDMLRTAQQAALAGANGSTDDASRNALSVSVEQVLSSIVSTGNSDQAGRFLFGGFKTDSPPFDLDVTADPPVTYAGDSGEMLFPVARATNTPANIPGDQVFNMGGAMDTSIPDLFSTLANLRDALAGNDQAGMQTALDEINQHLARITNFRGEVGARQQSLQLAQMRFSATELTLKEALSNTEDADLAESTIQLQQQQNIYQATVNAASFLQQSGLWEKLG
jgi:flagellar hook-associated protein 3 FlgL